MSEKGNATPGDADPDMPVDDGLQERIMGLIRQLDAEPHDRVRSAGVKSELIGIGMPAIPVLIGALDDKDRGVRFWAIEALGDIGKAFMQSDASRLSENSAGFCMTAVPALIGMLEDETAMRISACGALGKIGHALLQSDASQQPEIAAGLYSTAVPALIKAFGGRDANVRFWVAEALGMIGCDLAVPALVGRVADEEEIVRKNAAKALVRIIENGADVRLEDVRAALMESIRLHGGKNPAIRKEAAEFYSKISDALGRRKTSLYDGPLLKGAVRPPKGSKDGMFRSGNRMQFA